MVRILSSRCTSVIFVQPLNAFAAISVLPLTPITKMRVWEPSDESVYLLEASTTRYSSDPITVVSPTSTASVSWGSAT